MANSNSKEFTRSLDRLDRAVELSIRLVEQTGNKSDRVSALCEKLRRAQSKLDVHRKSQPLEKRKAWQQGDEMISCLVELLTIVDANEKKRG